MASSSSCALSGERGYCLDISWEACYGFCWYFAREVLLAGMSKSLISPSWIHKFERPSVVSIIQSPFPLKWVEQCLSSYSSHSWEKQKQILGDIFTNCKRTRALWLVFLGLSTAEHRDVSGLNVTNIFSVRRQRSGERYVPPSREGSLNHCPVYTGLDICVLCKNHSDLNGLSGLYQWVAFASPPTLGQPLNLDVSPGVKLVPSCRPQA